MEALDLDGTFIFPAQDFYFFPLILHIETMKKPIFFFLGDSNFLLAIHRFIITLLVLVKCA